MSKYAILELARLKSEKSFKDCYMHNERLYDVKNADPSKLQDDIVMIDTYGLTYEDLYQSTLSELKAQGVPHRTIRCDAVRGLEIILTFSREMTDYIDIQDWAEKSLNWLDKRFNPPNHEAVFPDRETGEMKTITVQNLKHVVVHMDETAKPHLHAFIIPIDKKGNLNSHYYNSGRANFIQMHTEYANVMKEFGLVRGEEHSTATPEQLSRYYNHILKAVEAELPEPLPGESVEDYKRRAEEVYQCALSNHRNEIVKKNQEIIRIRSAAEKRVATVMQDAKEEHQLFNTLHDMVYEEGETDIERERTLVSMVQENLQFQQAVAEHPNQEMAAEVFADYNALIQWRIQQQEAERQKRKEQEISQKEQDALSHSQTLDAKTDKDDER